jgi:hypothetical protein
MRVCYARGRGYNGIIEGRPGAASFAYSPG